MVGGDEADVVEIVLSFLEEGSELMDSLIASIEGPDLVLMRRSAHSIKSNARDMGAVVLADMCAHIEAKSAEGIAPAVVEIEQARAEMLIAVAELRRIFKIGDQA